MKQGDWVTYHQLVAPADELGFKLIMRICRVEKVCPVMCRVRFLTYPENVHNQQVGLSHPPQLIRKTELTVIK